MLGKRISRIAISFLTLSLTTVAWADMSLPYGWYIEANGGASRLTNNPFPGTVDTNGVAGNINVGYKFLPYLGAELGYTQLENITIKDSAGTQAGTNKHFVVDVAAKGILPISSSGFELFAKLGIARTFSNMNITNQTAANNIGLSDQNTRDTGLYTGFGAQYSFLPELAGNIQWSRAQGNNSTGSEELFSIGLTFILY